MKLNNIKNYFIKLTAEDIKLSDNGVYKHCIKLSHCLSDDKDLNNEFLLATAVVYSINGKKDNLLTAALNINENVFQIMSKLFKADVEKDNKVSVLDEFKECDRKLSVMDRVYLLEKYILPYLDDIGTEYFGFYNKTLKDTERIADQEAVDRELEITFCSYDQEVKGIDWKNTVQCIFVKDVDSKEFFNLKDPLCLRYFEVKNSKKLPKNFADLYEAYIYDEDSSFTSKELKLIQEVYNFRKSLYFSFLDEIVTITDEDRKVMNDFKNIKDAFDSIENLFKACEESFDTYLKAAIDMTLENQGYTLISAFVGALKKFVDYLERNWIPTQISDYLEIWKINCNYIYNHNLGYRFCYNLRNFDQHPRDSYEKSFFDEVFENTGACGERESQDCWLNINVLYEDTKFKNKMKDDYTALASLPEFSFYLRECMVDLRTLYFLPLKEFYQRNRDKIRGIYEYLEAKGFEDDLQKPVDDKELKRIGSDIAWDTVSVNDIKVLLEQLKNRGIIDEQEKRAMEKISM